MDGSLTNIKIIIKKSTTYPGYSNNKALYLLIGANLTLLLLPPLTTTITVLRKLIL